MLHEIPDSVWQVARGEDAERVFLWTRDSMPPSFGSTPLRPIGSRSFHPVHESETLDSPCRMFPSHIVTVACAGMVSVACFMVAAAATRSQTDSSGYSQVQWHPATRCSLCRQRPWRKAGPPRHPQAEERRTRDISRQEPHAITLRGATPRCIVYAEVHS